MRRVPLLLAACLLSACSLFEGGALGRKYVVFFSRGSTAIDKPAREVIALAADAAADNPAVDVLVAGYAGANGSLSLDEQLSAKRGELVASALRADGVAANRIRLRQRRPSNEDAVVGSRRVEIDFDR
jgi:outer membrane protein OmpA-like peptidoglycan-associated protein